MAKYTINRRNAILKTIEMWKLIIASDLSKIEWLSTEEGKPFLDKYKLDCPLCEYCKNVRIDGKEVGCLGSCPLYKQLGKGCVELGYAKNPEGFYLALLKLKTYK